MKKKNDNKKQNSAKQNTDKQDIAQELIQEADEQIEEIEEDKIARLEDQLRRAVADYQNLEKRTEEKRREWVLASNLDLVKKLLPVLDNLFLAQNHIRDDGLDLSTRKFLDVLKEEGVEEIETNDRNFDPHLMECVAVKAVDPSRGQMENKVLEEVRKGFIMNDIVLRPAQVVVGGQEN